MKATILEKVELVCPSCRQIIDGKFNQAPIKPFQVISEIDKDILQGTLKCQNSLCQMIYPIIDGVAIIVRSPGEYLKNFLLSIIRREDLHIEIFQLLQSSLQDNEYLNLEKQYLSMYMWSNYCDYLSRESQSSISDQFVQFQNATLAKISSVLNNLDFADINGTKKFGIDLGCSVGRTTFELSELVDTALGIDINFAHVRMCRELMNKGKATFHQWKIGHIYEENVIDFNAGDGKRSKPENMEFLVADALDPPFKASTFDIATSFNLIDTVNSPITLIRQMNALLRDSIKSHPYLVISSPFNWNTTYLNNSERLGSGIIAIGGEINPEISLKKVLTGEFQNARELDYEIISELDELPWTLRRHNRYFDIFLCYLVAAQKRNGAMS